MATEEWYRREYAQLRKIETDRFDEGLRLGRDPRNDRDYDLLWILQHGKDFDIQWEQSLCKDCQNYKECGFKTAVKCGYHTKIKSIDISRN